MQQHPNSGQGMTLAPVQASVPRYCFDNDMYWYIIECQMEDGRWFELSRYYADFYDFQIALLETFPEEAGNKKQTSHSTLYARSGRACDRCNIEWKAAELR